MRKKRNRLNDLKTEREKTRLEMDKARLAQADPTHLSFAEQARQMTQTEFMQFCPPPTDEEEIESGIRQGKMMRLWAQEYAKLLLLMYDQNLAEGNNTHRDIMNEWGKALIDQDSMREMIERRNLYPTSRFEWCRQLGGELSDLSQPGAKIYS